MEAMALDETHRDDRQKSGPEELKNAVLDQARAKEQEIKELRHEIRERRDEIKAKEQQIRELRDEIKAKEQEIRGVENEIASASETEVRETLEAKLRFARQAISSLRQDINSRDQQIINLQQDIKTGYQQIIHLEQDIRSLRAVQAGPALAGGEHTYSVPSLASPELLIGRSEAFFEDLLLPSLTDVPRDEFGLAEVLFPEQHGKLPVLPLTYRLIYHQSPWLAEKYLRLADNSKTAMVISTALEDDILPPKSEAEVSISVGGYLKKFFNLCNMSYVDNPRLELTFNKTEKRSHSNSTAILSGKRPDTLGIMCECSFLVGEEKVAALTAAEHDIRLKMQPLNPRFYGDLRFILGYIAAGIEFQWVLIGKDGKSLARIQPCLDLSNIYKRILFFLSIFNVYKLVTKMVQTIPRLPGRHAMYSELVEGDRTILFLSDCVCKKIRNFTSHCALRGTNFDVIKQAYSDAKGCAFLPEVMGEPILDRRGAIYRVVIRPLGYSPIIKSEEDTQLLAKCVCEALCVLHRKNLVHRDVRLPNVVQVSERRFMLIDLETVAESPFSVHPSFDHFKDWSDDMLENSSYTPKSDLYQLGKLLADEFASFTESPAAQQFVRRLMSKQFDAEEALKDSWLDVLAETQDPYQT